MKKVGAEGERKGGRRRMWWVSLRWVLWKSIE